MTVAVLHKQGECPYVIHKGAGDETWDVCDIAGDRCMLETQGYCQLWEEIKKEE